MFCTVHFRFSEPHLTALSDIWWKELKSSNSSELLKVSNPMKYLYYYLDHNLII